MPCISYGILEIGHLQILVISFANLQGSSIHGVSGRKRQRDTEEAAAATYVSSHYSCEQQRAGKVVTQEEWRCPQLRSAFMHRI